MNYNKGNLQFPSSQPSVYCNNYLFLFFLIYHLICYNNITFTIITNDKKY
jgi:hypothetical protein